MKPLIQRRSSICKILFLSFIFFVAGSCKKITDDLNISPNSPIDSPPDLLLSGAQTTSILVYEGNLARIGGIFANTFTGSDRQYVLFENYLSTAPDYDDTWDNLYQGVIAQAKIIQNKSAAVNNRVLVGIAQVMQAQAFGLAADLWGDIPFTEAGNAELYPQPAFDPQLDVYAGIQLMLDSAINNLASGVGQTAWNNSKDIFYGGNTAKWIAAAHTLKARFYLHTKNYALALSEAQQGIQDVSGNMMAPHGSTFGADFNVYYDFLTYNRPGYMTADGAYLPSLLDSSSPNYRGNSKTDETARFNYLFQEGLNTGGLDPNVLCDFDWGVPTEETGFFGANNPFPLITYEENQLIIAETQMKTGNAANALAALNAFRAYLNSGGYIRSGYIALGLNYDPYVLSDFSAGGIANAAGLLSQNDALLKEILEERYVTLAGQMEQFNDLRRTKNFIGVPPKTGSQIPQRYFYPQNEINSNANTPQLGSADLFVATPVNTSAY
ncbi:SusD/RagB family nutrient-binding outer membrane lipoprotein [Daejeonella oryzae]|uniref:SusD/RagB family nutrient-binding outer membrane lipoprotein n=1 Tax=Daejeonella oryzae TaxID=1122943 RepID=UPI0004249EC0|nr:SusD/RagB family nutrient-binding outer membrane lipoprotein [Daejeonella oryzae]